MGRKIGSKNKPKADQATLSQTVHSGSRTATRRQAPDRDVTDSDSEIEDIDLLQVLSLKYRKV